MPRAIAAPPEPECRGDDGEKLRWEYAADALELAAPKSRKVVHMSDGRSVMLVRCGSSIIAMDSFCYHAGARATTPRPPSEPTSTPSGPRPPPRIHFAHAAGQSA